MRIVHLTAGTGTYHCGSCLRDATLVAGLQRLGHDALLVPLYLPPVLEDDSDGTSCPLFFGGINVYLQQRTSVFRHTPAWLDRWFDRPGLLRWAAGKMHLTTPRDLGDITLSMLAGRDGRQRKEAEKLAEFLAARGPWDVLSISHGLLMGPAPWLRQRLGAKALVCSLQGEDSFLDGLSEPWRSTAWTAVGSLLRQADALVPVSRWYGDGLAKRLDIPRDLLHPVHNGIDLEGYQPASAADSAPTLGYLARLCDLKGLGRLVEAFIALAPRHPRLRLLAGGACTPQDAVYVDRLRQRLAAAGLGDRAEFRPNLSRDEKQDLLRSCTVFSVPATYGEAFGLYVIEALACAVPVALPPSGAFPELVAASGGGVLAADDSPAALATAIDRLLADPEHARHLGEHGAAAVREHFSAQRMAEGFAAVCAAAIARPIRPIQQATPTKEH
ncbi:glycosyl transferase family 1 [Planctomycetota bacterium]|nr:glycosyl transferase family 1 [Planctomycetota bacterium]